MSSGRATIPIREPPHHWQNTRRTPSPRGTVCLEIMGSEPDASKSIPARTWLSACYSSVQWLVFGIFALTFLLTLPVWLLLNYIFSLPTSTFALLLMTCTLSLYFAVQPWTRIEAETNPASYAFAKSTIGELLV